MALLPLGEVMHGLEVLAVLHFDILSLGENNEIKGGSSGWRESWSSAWSVGSLEPACVARTGGIVLRRSCRANYLEGAWTFRCAKEVRERS